MDRASRELEADAPPVSVCRPSATTTLTVSGSSLVRAHSLRSTIRAAPAASRLEAQGSHKTQTTATVAAPTPCPVSGRRGRDRGVSVSARTGSRARRGSPSTPRPPQPQTDQTVFFCCFCSSSSSAAPGAEQGARALHHCRCGLLSRYFPFRPAPRRSIHRSVHRSKTDVDLSVRPFVTDNLTASANTRNVSRTCHRHRRRL